MLQSGLKRLETGGVDVVLLDLALSEGKGLESFNQAREVAGRVPIIVLSSLDDENLALKAVQEGAQDYIVKVELNEYLLVRAIRYAIDESGPSSRCGGWRKSIGASLSTSSKASSKPRPMAITSAPTQPWLAFMGTPRPKNSSAN